MKNFKNINNLNDLLKDQKARKNVYFKSDLNSTFNLFTFYAEITSQLFLMTSSHSLASELTFNEVKTYLLNKIESEKKMRLEKRYISFKEMKKHLTSNKADTLTFFVDQLLLKANTLSELFDKINEVKKTTFDKSNDFKSIAIIKKHIRYRQNHNRIVFTKNKKDQIRMIEIDYKAESSQDSLF